LGIYYDIFPLSHKYPILFPKPHKTIESGKKISIKPHKIPLTPPINPSQFDLSTNTTSTSVHGLTVEGGIATAKRLTGHLGAFEDLRINHHNHHQMDTNTVMDIINDGYIMIYYINK